jgi:hypothetical protein
MIVWLGQSEDSEVMIVDLRLKMELGGIDVESEGSDG